VESQGRERKCGAAIGERRVARAAGAAGGGVGKAKGGGAGFSLMRTGTRRFTKKTAQTGRWRWHSGCFCKSRRRSYRGVFPAQAAKLGLNRGWGGGRVSVCGRGQGGP